MLRSLRPKDFVELPSLSEAGTLTLVEELEAAAKQSRRVKPGVLAALARLLDAYAELTRRIAARERAGSAADPRARAADRALDDAWAALQSWLLGWTRLPDRAHGRLGEARALYAALFPKGLQFLTLEFKNEWKESQARLDAIAKERRDELIDALGGAAFLETIARAHRAYGEVLQIQPGRDEGPDGRVQEALAQTQMAMREYVAQVAATVRYDAPETVAAAAALLAPISALGPLREQADDDADTVVDGQ